ncbi:MAG: hypothetical protein ABI382_10990 [Nakamurella sp.]
MSEGQIVRGRRRSAAHSSEVRSNGVWARARWIAAAAGASVVLASCGTVPGAAVTIDGTQVSTQALRAQISEVAGADAAADPDASAAHARSLLTTIIRHQLALEVAKKKGIDVSQSDVNGFIAQYDSYRSTTPSAPAMPVVLGVPAGSVEATSYDLLVFDKLMAAIPAEGVDVTDIDVTVDAVPAATWADAVAARTKYLADPALMTADAAAALAANPQLPGGHESLLEQPGHAIFGIFSTAAGEILLVSQGTQGYLVVRVTDRTEKPGMLTKKMISDTNTSAGLQSEIALASLLLGPEAEALKVRLNPRFGVWDPRVVQVVAGRS